MEDFFYSQKIFYPRKKIIFPQYYQQEAYPIHSFVVAQMEDLYKKNNFLLSFFQDIVQINLKANLCVKPRHYEKAFFPTIYYSDKNIQNNNQNSIKFKLNTHKIINGFYNFIKFYKTYNSPIYIKKLNCYNMEDIEQNLKKNEIGFQEFYFRKIKNDILCLHLFRIFKGKKKSAPNSVVNSFFSRDSILVSILNYIIFKEKGGSIVYQAEIAGKRFRHLLNLPFGVSKYPHGDKLIKLLDMDLNHRSLYIEFPEDIRQSYNEAKRFIENFDCSYLYCAEKNVKYFE